MKRYDLIVVGGGHAGIEATFAAANLNLRVLLISLSLDKVAMMPCNPAIGGPAKGILTREIDALGGMQGIFADQAMIQIKELNQSRGPAVRALRAQIDKEQYSKLAKQALIDHPNIDFMSGMVVELIVKNRQVVGVKTTTATIMAPIIILTTGTYLDARILRGDEQVISGPDGQQTTAQLSTQLRDLGLKTQRLKTGTPPRIYADSIDFSQVEKEVLPEPNFNFSARSNVKLKGQVACYLTYTNEKTHQIILDNLDKSPMYSQHVASVGPRYCPSIEDKVVRFSDKKRHQLFYEPETKDGTIIYLQGLSSSMPIAVQRQILKTLPGLANARVQKWAYAIEYDALDPTFLQQSLECKTLKNLFLAGQINGSSGYEEAAAQGLMAGINAARKLHNKPPLILQRDQAYIGVLIDDLVTRGTNEPYRMLTSRAEYRLLLRNDNADQRLSAIGHDVGLISDQELERIEAKYQAIAKEQQRLATTYISSKSQLAQKYHINNGISLLQLLIRPGVDVQEISNFAFIYEVAVQARLAGYIKKQTTTAQKLRRLEYLKIPPKIDYDQIMNLASEARSKLKQVRPETIGQAARVSGVNPADIQMLMFYIEYRSKQYEN